MCKYVWCVCVQVRNLTYMVTRREKIKRSVCRVQEQIFHHHVRLLEQGRLSGEPLTAPDVISQLIDLFNSIITSKLFLFNTNKWVCVRRFVLTLCCDLYLLSLEPTSSYSRSLYPFNSLFYTLSPPFFFSSFIYRI